MTHLDTHPNAFKLSLFIGQWAGRGEVFSTPWSPAATCESLWQFGFDNSGYNLIHDYHETRSNKQQFNGHGVLTIAPDTKEVLWFWFDDFGFPPLDPSRGNWDLEKLVLMKNTPRGLGRSTFVFDHNVFDYFIEAQPHGENSFIPVMRGTFKKFAASNQSARINQC